jgi:hypothetical protein
MGRRAENQLPVRRERLQRPEGDIGWAEFNRRMDAWLEIHEPNFRENQKLAQRFELEYRRREKLRGRGEFVEMQAEDLEGWWL